MATLFVDKVDPQSGTSLEIGSSGDTITIPSGCTITNNGTQSGFGGVNTPAFEAYRSDSQGISDGTWTKVQFDVEEFDTYIVRMWMDPHDYINFYGSKN